VLSNLFSEDICTKIIDTINEDPGEKLLRRSGQNVHAYEKQLLMTHPFAEVILSKLNELARYLGKRYHLCFSQTPVQESVCLRKIYGPTKLHEDGLKADENQPESRTVSVIIALNSDYDGGEIVFPCQNFKTKLEQGDAIVFPPFWTHPHYTESLNNNTFRYTITTWLHK
jgi:predicted 2-oxoglutarate/Fe(II)-dependent dioxygenase YbiX